MSEPIDGVLDCIGPGLDEEWGPLFEASVSHVSSGLGPLAAPSGLLDLANSIVERWKTEAPNMAKIEATLRGLAPAWVLKGFCWHGFLTALFWQCFDAPPSSQGSIVADCLRELVRGPIDTQEWGPIELSQSTRWPVKIIDIRLLYEHWSACYEVVIADCPDASHMDLSPGGLMYGWYEGDSPHSGAVAEAEAAVAYHLAAPPVWFFPRIFRKAGEQPISVDAPLRLVVIGSHQGSNLEPLSLIRACLEAGQVAVESIVYGTRYPFPEFMCNFFGHCLRNEEVDDIIDLMMRQMYKPTWEPEVLLGMLAKVFYTDSKLRLAELFVCAQPMAVCSLARAVTETPMFVYEAFPLVGATPSSHKHMLLLQFREMFQNPRRTSFLAYSTFLANQFEYQVGHQPLCIRPHSLYATGDENFYNPDRENPRVLISRVAGWARDGAQALVHFAEQFAIRDLRPYSNIRLVFLGAQLAGSETIGGVAVPFSYRELRRYRAAIFFPWDFGMLMFSELYNIGVPLIVPNHKWTGAIIKRMLEYTDFGWWQARSDTAVAIPDQKGQVWPWLDGNSTLPKIWRLYEETDFIRWPHVHSFGSLPELMLRLTNVDFDQTSAAMQQWNSASLQVSLSIVSRTLGALLGEGQPPNAGESSCV